MVDLEIRGGAADAAPPAVTFNDAIPQRTEYTRKRVDKQEQAVETVLKQAEVVAAEWALPA